MSITRFDLAKQVSIINYLQSVGITVKERNGKFTAKAEWRGDTNPSVSINKVKNRWHDFGTGQSGSIIDLVCLIEGCEPITAVNKLLGDKLPSISPFEASNSSKALKEKSIEVVSVGDIRHPALKRYLLHERKIPNIIYNQYLKEVHYRCGNREYFATGFQNDRGGWALRSAHCKLSTEQYFTHINNGSNTLLIFEGVMDFLTYLTIERKNVVSMDFLILNSTANTPKASQIIGKYDYIGCYLDNDDTGRTTLELIRTYHPLNKALNYSGKYKGYNDLNEWHVNQINTSEV